MCVRENENPAHSRSDDIDERTARTIILLSAHLCIQVYTKTTTTTGKGFYIGNFINGATPNVDIMGWGPKGCPGTNGQLGNPTDQETKGGQPYGINWADGNTWGAFTYASVVHRSTSNIDSAGDLTRAVAAHLPLGELSFFQLNCGLIACTDYRVISQVYIRIWTLSLVVLQVHSRE